MNIGDYVILKPYEDIKQTADYAYFGFNDMMRRYVERRSLRRITRVYELGSHTAISLLGSEYPWSPEWVQTYLGQELEGFTI
jgi:hypothetical protein